MYKENVALAMAESIELSFGMVCGVAEGIVY